MKHEEVETIHESLMNGQRRQMVNQIDEYGSDFWEDYEDYLVQTYESKSSMMEYFTDATISYFRIKNR